MTPFVRHAVSFAALTCLVAPSVGCASRAKLRTQQTEIDQLKAQLAAVQREQAEQRQENEQVRNQLYIVHERAKTALSRTTYAPPPKLEVVKLSPAPAKDPLAPQVKVARAVPAPDPVDAEAYDPSADEAEMFSFSGDDEEAAAASDVRAQPAPKVAAVKPTALPTIESTSTSRGKEDPMTMYQRAFEIFQKKNFGDATIAFEAFVRANPTHDYADNAYYWMGECYYAEKEYSLAIGEFQKIPELYPGGNKVPDALLKIGLSYQNLGNNKNAEKTLRQLIDAYPQSEAAKIAKQRLDQVTP